MTRTLSSERNSEMAVGNVTQSRPLETVGLVRIILKNRAEPDPYVLVIEHGELNGWITHSRKHRFSFEAEFIGRSELGRA
jgi:hypothetical protein